MHADCTYRPRLFPVQVCRIMQLLALLMGQIINHLLLMPPWNSIPKFMVAFEMAAQYVHRAVMVSFQCRLPHVVKITLYCVSQHEAIHVDITAACLTAVHQ